MEQIRKTVLIDTILIMLIIFLPGQFINAFASDIQEEIKKGIVKIVSYEPNDNIETGAGVIVAIKDQRIYIMTANHVIENADSIIVKFYDYPTAKFKGERFEKYDETNDLVVIYVTSAKISSKISKLHKGNISKIKALDKVLAIGHPLNNEWEFSSAEIRSFDHSQIRFAGDAVSPGNSGGALLNNKFQMIGLITEKRPRDGVALRIDVASAKLKEWQIPFELKAERKKWPWFVAGGVALGIVGAILLPHENEVYGGGSFPLPPGRP